MDAKRLEAALRRAATVVDVPGAPLSLRLDTVVINRDLVRLSWSFLDPERWSDDPRPHTRRVAGQLEVLPAPGSPDELARSWWAEAQLAAAYRFKLQVDADWTPGRPYVRKVWTTEEAWEALLRHLGAGAERLQVDGSDIRVVRRGEETVYRIDPAAWAAYLTGPEAPDPPEGDHDHPADPVHVVPAAGPTVDGLPQWAADDLSEAAGAWGPVVGLVGGELVGLDA